MDNNIPDIKTAERMASDRTMYEDGTNIYLHVRTSDGSAEAVYAINKATRSIEKILDDCTSFTLDNGIIYWVKYTDKDNGKFNEIWTYDTNTKQKTKTATLPYSIYELFIKGKTMYLCLDTRKPDQEDGSSLYTADLNGGHLKKVLPDAYSMGITDGKIYHSTSYGADGGNIYEYNTENRKISQVTSGIAEGWNYEVINGKYIMTMPTMKNLFPRTWYPGIKKP